MSYADIRLILNRAATSAAITGAELASTSAFADPLSYAGLSHAPHRVIEQILPDSAAVANLHATKDAAHLRRQVVEYPTREAPGTIVIDTPNTYLYLVLNGGRAIRYGIGVGREGFTWSGVKTVERKAEWPDWIPPVVMLDRQPYLPRFMAGGPGNPLGARAMYLGGTVYRIHGTNDPSTIGQHVSSGCIRLVNDDVIDLHARVNVGTKVVVLPMRPANARGSRHTRSSGFVLHAHRGGQRRSRSRALLKSHRHRTWTEQVMNTSLRSADRNTHLKVVAVSLVAAIAVVVAALNGRIDGSRFATANAQAAAPVVVKAGKPTAVATNASIQVR